MTSNESKLDNNLGMDLIDIMSRLFKRRKFIIKCCLIGMIAGLVVGFSIPKRYKAAAKLAPEAEQKMGAGVTSIASMMGVSLNNSVDAISLEMFPDVIHSTPFICDLFDLPVQFKRKGEVINTTLLDYMQNYQKQAWWAYVFNAPFKVMGWAFSLISSDNEDEIVQFERNPVNLSKEERKVVKFFAENIQVLIDKKTDKTTIALELQDPLVVYTVMEAVVNNLKEYMSDYRTSKARQDVQNLSVICEERRVDYYKAQQAYADYSDANKNVIRLSSLAEKERLQQEMNLAYQVYSQVAQQLEGARIQEQQAKPVFAIIEPVAVPIKKSAPSKAKVLIIYTFLACCAALCWVLFGEEYWKKFKDNL